VLIHDFFFVIYLILFVLIFLKLKFVHVLR